MWLKSTKGELLTTQPYCAKMNIKSGQLTSKNVQGSVLMVRQARHGGLSEGLS